MIDCGVNSSLQFHNVTSDHRPVFLHLAAPNVYSSPSPKVRRKVKRSKPVSIDFAVLKNDSFYQRRLLLEIEHQLSRSGMDFSFESFNNVLTAACKTHLPKRKRIRAACWMSVNIVRIRELLNRRRRAKISWLSIGRPEGPTKSLYLEEKRLCQRELRAIKYQYYIDKTKLAYAHFVGNDAKSFSCFVKTFVPELPVTLPSRLFLKDGITLTTSTEERKERIREHYCDLLNQRSTLPDNIEDFLPTQCPIIWELQDQFTIPEVQKSASRMYDNKGLGIDRLAIEVIKYLGSLSIFGWFVYLANKCMELSFVPSEWKDVIITPIFKKGDIKNLDNYRGISLISHYGKLLEKLIEARLYEVAERVGWFPESQNGFRVKRSTVHSIFVSRLVSSLCIENNINCCKAYIDFVKAYDKVNQSLMWIILSRLGVPPLLLQLIIAIHEGSKASVKVDGELSAPFVLSCGLKQGSMLSPLLFNIFSGAMIEEISKRIVGLGLKFYFQQGGNIFDISRIKGARVITIWDNLFADDAELLAENLFDLQRIVNVFVEVATAYGQEVSLKKSEVLVTSTSEVDVSSTNITIDGKALSNVLEFNYLGSIENEHGNIDDELDKH